MPTTDDYDGDKFLTRINGSRAVTPLMMLALVAIIHRSAVRVGLHPAIYGLREDHTSSPPTLSPLMGLRQLYFLIGGLLDRLVYLSVGLSITPAHRREVDPARPARTPAVHQQWQLRRRAGDLDSDVRSGVIAVVLLIARSPA